LCVDRLTRQARLDGRLLDLTPREFDLLCDFAQNPDRIFSRTDLLNRVWGLHHDGYEHTVNTHINRLRGKIESDPRNPKLIVTVWGVGYKFCLPAGAADAPT
jgi:two-component system, OmpR family, response regulator